jgi:cell division protein FtsX
VIPALAAALRRSGRAASDRPRASLWTLLALACVFAAAGVAAIVAASVSQWSAPAAPSGGTLVVYLGDGVSGARAEQLASQLRSLQGVQRAELVSQAESAKRLTAALGPDAALLDGVDPASLPSSIEVTLAPGVRDVIAMSPTVRALRGAPGVADVAMDAAPVATAAPSSPLSTFAWGAAALCGGLALIVVLAAIRIRLERRADERAVYDLLGASPAFAAGPIALAGALHGFLAATVAGIAITCAVRAWGDAAAAQLGAPAASTIALPAPLVCLLFVAAGAALGFVGGLLAAAARTRGR